MRIRLLAFGVFLLLAPQPAAAQAFEFFPGAQYDPGVPTLEKVVGHRWAEKITMHHEVERYLRALDAASPRVTLVSYGQTWEGRTLYYLIVASETNQARIAEIKAAMKKLRDPRTHTDAEAAALAAAMPAVAWLGYGVHGNEISSTDAALLTAYHLVAAQNDPVASEILEKVVVLIDPMQNPDGRDRFIQHFRQSVGRWPDADPQAAEHNEMWPAGRFNHYLFDMNRDWFAGTQPESRGRAAAFLDWFPVVYVDLHEMGGNSTYYFAPPAPPLNPNLPQMQVQWWSVFGKNNAEWFDRFQFDYFTRDVYDSFYPGYGEGWPLFHGAIGMTYEQASVRGLVLERTDRTTMHYRDSVQHHFISSISTLQTAARNREALLKHLREFHRSAIEEGQREAVKEFILPPGRDPGRTAHLAASLMRQGIEVRRAEAPFTAGRVRDYGEGKLQSREFPAGTFVVSLAQPAKRLAKTLLEKQTSMDEAFLKEQVRRRSKRLPEQLYDVTAWSLPLLYDVECFASELPSTGSLALLQDPPRPAGNVHGGPSKLLYLVPWGANAAAQLLAEALREGVRAHMADKSFSLGAAKYPAGTLIFKVKDNPADLQARLERLAASHGAEVFASDSAWVDEGVSIGSNYVRFIEPPKIALAWNQPASPTSAGWTRYLLEQVYGLPLTPIHTQSLGAADLTKYNVLVLPHAGGFGGGYAGTLGENGARRIREWVQAGGTLISFGEATRWLTEERVGLLSTQRELRGGKADTPERPAAAPAPAGAPATPAPSPAPRPAETAPPKGEFNLEQFIQPERELPDATPGALFRIKLDTEHWMAAGYDGDAYVMVDSSNIFQPLKLDRGVNVGVYAAGDESMASGFTWEASRKQLASKAYLMVQPHGRGLVIAFAEDPNYRAFMHGLNLLFLNAVLFGPAH